MTSTSRQRVIHINRPTGVRVLRFYFGRRRWCFGCRKHYGGLYKLLKCDSPWYEPFWTYSCDGCGHDRRWLADWQYDGCAGYAPDEAFDAA